MVPGGSTKLACVTTAYVHNRCPTSALCGRTPEESAKYTDSEGTKPGTPRSSHMQATQPTSQPPVLDESSRIDVDVKGKPEKLPTTENTLDEVEDTGNVEERSEPVIIESGKEEGQEQQNQPRKVVPYVLISPRRTRDEHSRVAMIEKPATMDEALNRKDVELWREAAKKELASIKTDGTVTIKKN